MVKLSGVTPGMAIPAPDADKQTGRLSPPRRTVNSAGSVDYFQNYINPDQSSCLIWALSSLRTIFTESSPVGMGMSQISRSLVVPGRRTSQCSHQFPNGSMSLLTWQLSV